MERYGAMTDEITQNLGEEEQETPVFTVLADLSDREKEEVLQQFTERLEVAEKHMQTLYPSMIGNYKKYCSVADPIKNDQGEEITDRANLFIPYPFAIVECEMPRLAGRLPRARAFPRRDIEKEKVEAIQDLIYYSLDRMNFIELQTLWIRQYAIYGWSPLYYFWRDETSNVLERVPQEIPGGAETAYVLQRGRRKKFDDFWTTVLDVFDCFFQPGVERIEEGDYFFFREWHSAKDLKKMAKAGLLYEKEVLEYLKDNPSSQRAMSGAGRMERDEIKGLNPGTTDHTYGKYELMWMLESERVVMVLDRRVVAKVGDNPNPLQEIPILNCNLNPMVSEPIGVGTIEALAGLPDKLNALSNGRLDYISLILNPVFLANRSDQQTDFKNIRFTAGNVILTGDIERSLKKLEMGNVDFSSESEVRTTKEEMQFTSGISDYLMGTKSSAKLVDTATGVSTVVREANARFALKLASFESGSLRKLIEIDHAYQMTYMPDKKRIHILGPRGMEVKDITIDDILTQCDFVVEPGSSIPLDQIARREALMSLLDRVAKLPTVVRVDKFMKEVLESFDLRNVEDLLVQQEGPVTALEDVKLAEAENVALSLNMEIPVKGNAGNHLGIHQSADMASWDQNSQARMQDHIAAHQMQLQQEMQQQQMQMQGGPNALPNPAGPGPEGQVPGQQPNMGGPPGVPGSPAGPAQQPPPQ
jgi:hypothetical protein